MSRRQRRPKQEVFAFESSKGENDKFAKIYASMLQSPAWKNLTKPQQILYVYMKLQFRSETREKVPGKPDVCFYFNQTLIWALYKHYVFLQRQKCSDSKWLYRVGGIRTQYPH